ncbi:MAG TPA: PAS domain S-box protein [Tepidiformaceae bacterium]|nr:PAS domain S-box protein [Tepidiformaceae bacterium]
MTLRDLFAWRDADLALNTLEALGDAVIAVDPAGTVAAANGAASHLFGFEGRPLTGHPLSELVPAALAARHPGLLRDYFSQDGKPRQMAGFRPVSARRADGSSFPCEISLSVVETESGALAVAVVRDVTERTRAQEAIRAMERTVQGAFDALSDDIAVLDATGLVVLVNRAWEAKVGKPSFADRVGPGHDYLAACDPLLASALSEILAGTRQGFATDYGALDGDAARHFTVRAFAIPGDGPARAVVSHQDVTALHAASRAARWGSETLQAADTAVIEISPGGVVTYANRALQDLLHATSPVQGRPLDRFVRDPGDAVVLMLSVAGSNAAHGTVRLHRDDGAVTWVDYAASRLTGAAGDEARERVVITFTDVSARAAIEASYRRAETNLREAQRVARIGSFDWTAEGDVYWWSEEMYRVYGYEPGAVEPGYAPVLARIHPDDLETFYASNQAAMAGKAHPPTEYRIVLPDGSVRDLRLHADITFDDAGRPLRMLGTAQDVTEMRAGERAFRDTAAELTAVFDTEAVGLTVLDSSGFVVRANATAARIAGELGQVGYGPGFDFLASLPSRMREESRTVLETAAGGTPLVTFRHFPDTDGRERWFRSSMSPIAAGEQGHRRVLMVWEEETERRASEEALRRAEKFESLGVLAGGVAHDFNNLLVGVLGNAEMARARAGDDAELNGYLDDILLAGRRAADLARQMLAYAGRSHVQREAVDVNAIAAEMEHLLRARVGPLVQIQYEPGEGIPPIDADASQVRQILMNLVVNGAEAMDQGGTITIATGLASLPDDLSTGVLPAQPGLYATITVRDTGRGMEPRLVNRIFDPFFTTKFTGRGLGLATALGLVRTHGGTLDVRSAPGQGSAFRVCLPLGETQDAEAATPAGLAAPGPVEVQPGSVLVVDDDAIVRMVVKHGFLQAGWHVAEAESGEEAIALLETQPFTLAVCDLTMPGMRGTEFAALARERKNPPAVILMTGYDPEGAGMTAGMGYVVLPKPFGLAELMAAVRASLPATGESSAR